MANRLEEAIEKLKGLPEDKQSYVAMLIDELSNDEVYEIPDDAMAAVLEGLRQAKNGEVATQEEVDALLNKPWA